MNLYVAVSIFAAYAAFLGVGALRGWEWLDHVAIVVWFLAVAGTATLYSWAWGWPRNGHSPPFTVAELDWLWAMPLATTLATVIMELINTWAGYRERMTLMERDWLGRPNSGGRD